MFSTRHSETRWWLFHHMPGSWGMFIKSFPTCICVCVCMWVHVCVYTCVWRSACMQQFHSFSIISHKTASTMLPQDSTLLPQDSTLLPQDSTLLPQDSTLLPQDSTLLLQNSTQDEPHNYRTALGLNPDITRQL